MRLTYFQLHLNFHEDINESKVLAAANQFMSLGLKDAGYEYINIDVSHPICFYCRSHRLKETARIVGLLYQAETVPTGSYQIRRSSLMALAVSLNKFMLLVSRSVSTGGFVCFAFGRVCDNHSSVAMLVLRLVLASPDHWVTKSLMQQLLPAGVLIISNMVSVIEPVELDAILCFCR